MKSTFLPTEELLCLYDMILFYTWLLVDMEFLRVQLNISLVRCAHSWAIELNTRREIPNLRTPMHYSLYISNNITEEGSVVYL